MQINWFTVIAQIINFLVLVWLLKRFLYQPILNAIDEREKKISERLEQAELLKVQARKQEQDLEKRNADFDLRKKEMLQEALAAADEQGERLLQKAGEAAEALRLKEESIRLENKDALDRRIVSKTQESVMAIAKKALAELASVGLEEQTIAVFLVRLEQMDAGEKERLRADFRKGPSLVLVRSAFELLGAQQAAVQAALTKLLEGEPKVQFATAPELISGVELAINGYKLVWCTEGFLNAMEIHIAQASQGNTDTKSEGTFYAK